jgi:hypothetical protein
MVLALTYLDLHHLLWSSSLPPFPLSVCSWRHWWGYSSLRRQACACCCSCLSYCYFLVSLYLSEPPEEWHFSQCSILLLFTHIRFILHIHNNAKKWKQHGVLFYCRIWSRHLLSDEQDIPRPNLHTRPVPPALPPRGLTQRGVPPNDHHPSDDTLLLF